MKDFESDLEDFYEFERSMAYANATVSLLGVIGNILAVVVLLSKDMRKNCFSQLLIGKETAIYMQ